jgi:pyridoxal phosphate enzyme (YggS family)
MSVTQQLLTLKNTLPESVTLIAVSKTKPKALILEAYETGHRDFGENKVQELTSKFEQLPKDIKWHMIGHLQRNKVKYIGPFVHIIHSVDSKRLLDEIQKQAKNVNKRVAVLLQVHIAKETTKFGLDQEELEDVLKLKEHYTHITFKGLMGMATFTEDSEAIRSEFTFIKTLHDKHLGSWEKDPILSIGMSSDYQIAIDCGSNMIRIGSAIFGHR